VPGSLRFPTASPDSRISRPELGTGRPSVSLAAGVLENAGLIENMRGTVKILNRKSLEAVACECYGVIQHFNGGLGLK